MNAMVWTLIVTYAVAVIVIGVCVVKNLFRSVFRGAVALGLAVIALPLSVLLTRMTMDGLTSKILHVINIPLLDSVKEAFPSMEEGAVALVHMVAAPEIWRIVFLLVLALFAIAGTVACHFVEKSKPSLAKRHKGIGAAIGAVCGVVLVVGLLSPTAGYSAESPAAMHTLEEYEQATHMDEQTLDKTVQAEKNAAKAAKTPLLVVVRALGGEAIFDSLTTVTVDGHKTDLHTELHALDELGADVAVLSAVPMDEYTDKEYETIKEIGRSLEKSALLRVLGAAGASALSRAWLKDQPFLGIEKPELETGVDFALNAVMIVMKDTTKDTIAKDVRGLAPAISAALRAFNAVQSLTGPTTPTTPGASIPSTQPEDTAPEAPTESELTDTLDVLMEAVVESAESPETQEVLIRAGIGLVAKELEQFFFAPPSTGTTTPAPAPSTPVPPTGGDTPSAEDPSAGDDAPAQDPAPTPIITVPEGTEITQEEYDTFVSELTDFAVSGGLKEAEEAVVAGVKDIRDMVGIDITDEMCEQLVSGVLNSPYASLFR